MIRLAVLGVLRHQYGNAIGLSIDSIADFSAAPAISGASSKSPSTISAPAIPLVIWT